jgi:hypothetical protein
VREIVIAQQGLAGAVALLDAIDKLAATLAAASAGLAGDLEAAAQDLGAARTAIKARDIGPETYADQLSKADRDLGAARAAANERPLDPIAAARLATAARGAAADVLAKVRHDAEQAARFAAAVESSITAAQAEVDRAADFIATRRVGVRRRARTRLVEAERLLERALDARETDPKAAMAQAQRADELAGEAYTLALNDFARWDAGRGGASPSSGGSDIAGAILGGIIGGILSGGGGRAGWGGSSWGAPGPPGGGGGGGGWGGGGHSSGGGFGGFGGGGGGGGHARGGRW